MFRWCSYCFTFLGEVEPLTKLAATHGVCAACEEHDAISDEEAIEHIQPIATFYKDMVLVAREDPNAPVDPEKSATAILERGARLGIRPTELLMGILQPSLHEIGRLWEAARIQPAQEARLTRLCDEVLERMLAEQETRLPQPHEVYPVVLTVAEGNTHTLGVRMVAFAFREEGHDVRLLLSALPTEKLLDLCETIKPSIVGISVALETQMAYVHEVMRGLAEREIPAQVIAGGHGVPPKARLPDGVVRWPGITRESVRALISERPR